MNRKTVYTLGAIIAVSSATVFAAEEATEMTLEERVAALESGSKQSDWSENIKLKGDLRYRFEHIDVGGSTAQSRQRIRVRLGAFADVNDFTTAGIQIRTGGTANSGNQTIGGTWDGKDVFFDLAYISLAPNEGAAGEVTLGKMKYPWKVVTDMIWDSDVNPEGLAYNYGTALDSTDVFVNLGGFKVVETPTSHDMNLFSGQIGATRDLCDSAKGTLGASIFNYDNSEDFLTGIDYRVVEAFTEVALKDVLPMPCKVYGDYVSNIDESNDQEGFCVGVKLGDAKKGDWEAKFGYRRLEANAAPPQFADSDYAGGGTDIKGFRAKAAYNIAKHLQLGVTGIAGKRIDTDTSVNTLQLDLIAKF